MTYDFSRFSPQSFERLIQALAAATVGSRVQVYGAGKDGAREATYTGRCRIADADWNGYVVFQAKHRGAGESLGTNADWLIRQIDLEMAKFEDLQRGLKRPDYYVIASNVRLSAAAAGADGKGQGGIDKVSDHLGRWTNKLGFKGYHVWHADLLASLLDSNPGVRTTFDFWVQPSDLLAGVLRGLSGPNQTDTLTKYLQDGLRQSREIKTRDIGQAVGRTVTIEDVFIDLPVNLHPNKATWHLAPRDPETVESEVADDAGEYEVDFEFLQPEFSESKVLAQLVHQAADTFSPHIWSDVEELDPQGRRCRHQEPLPNRVVLLGGPGQGKSTIGQFLAQYSRARLLNEMRKMHSPETNAAVLTVLKSADSQNIPRIGPLRYPFHVELPRYADLLSEANRADNHLSIVDHLAREISKGTNPGPNATTVIKWLKTMPSIIILDGLDEVPHSGNRSRVISAIEELLDTLHGADADSFIFATSRPQGYQQELSPQHWAHWELDALTSDDALNLAHKVAPVLVGEATRREEILAILADAAQEEATASLMTTPLQVMLLFHLVSTHNNIPKDRWTLFHRHYEILRDREIAKGGAPGATIRTYRTQIDRIHQDAGYLLHLRAEVSGGADAYFTDEEFTALVRLHLEHDGFEDSIDALAKDIANLATDRLVFLRSAVEGKIAFDVRSLQEFMAAGRLTASPEASIRDRLYEIAGRAHWNLVFKIACSKIYASTGHEALHNVLVGLLDALDAGDRTTDDRFLLTGSRLAVDLLLDGTMASMPNYRRKLLSRAMNLLSSPESSAISRLRGALDLGQRSLLEPLFIKALNNTSAVRRCTLRLLAQLSLDQGGAGWVTELLLAWWPADHEELFAVFDESNLPPAQSQVGERLRAAQWQASPTRVINWIDRLTADPELSVPVGLHICDGHKRRSQFQLRGTDGSMTPISFTYCAMAGATRVDEPPSDALPVWKIARAAAVFSEKPSAATAAAFLQVVRDQNHIGVTLGIPLPWPLDALVRSIGDNATCNIRIDELRAGRHGDQDIWKRNEESWTANGVAEPDIRTGNDFDAALLDIICQKSPPLVGRLYQPRIPDGENVLLALVDRLPDSAWARSILLFYASRQEVPAGPRLISFLLEADSPIAASSFMRSSRAAALVRAIRQVTEKEPLIARLREIMLTGELNILVSIADLHSLVGLINQDPDFRELIPTIAIGYLRPQWPHHQMALPEAIFVRTPRDTPEIAASVSLLRIATEHPSLEVEEDIKILFAAKTSFPSRLLAASPRHKILPLCREILIRRMSRHATRAYQLLQHIDEARPVGLGNDGCALSLFLPPALPGR